MLQSWRRRSASRGEASSDVRPPWVWRAARWIGLLVLIYGGILWCAGPVLNAMRPAWASDETEFPMGSLRAVAVDSAGRVYCGSMWYGRIQVYGADGDFLRGWFVSADWGSFRLRVSQDDVLEVATARNDRLYRYDASGRLLEELPNAPRHYEALGGQGERECRDAAGSRYAIRAPVLCPRVVRVDPSGSRAAIVRTTLGSWLLMAPFPAGPFWGIGVAVLVLTDRRLQRVVRALAGRGSSAETPRPRVVQ